MFFPHYVGGGFRFHGQQTFANFADFLISRPVFENDTPFWDFPFPGFAETAEPDVPRQPPASAATMRTLTSITVTARDLEQNDA
jgi:hypothetical protein